MSALATLLAGAAGFAMGAIWYMTLGKPWMAAVGRTEEEVKASRNPFPFIIALACNLVVATMMQHIFNSSGVAGILEGLVGGAGIGLFLAAPWILTNYAFADRPRALWAIDAGHAVLACTAMGTVLSLFA